MAPAVASAALRESPAGAVLGTLWRLVVFPHAGFTAPGSFPDRPGTLLTYPGAVSIAILQWSLLVLGVAWLSRAKPRRTQVLISIAAVLGMSLAVLSVALLSGASIRMD
jgi:hypothetical protein